LKLLEKSQTTKGVKAFKLIDGKLYTGGVGGSKKTLFEEGKTYEVSSSRPIELCKHGFHFFKTRNECFGINFFNKETVLHEVEAYGEVILDTYKCVAKRIKIGKRIQPKVDKNNNSGDYNSGYKNSGNNNSGYKNSGDCNSGDCNSGDKNSGNYNSGNYNSGNCNSGNYNSGNYNSGSYNSGYYNSGSYNSGDYNSGYNNSGNNNSGNYNSGYKNSGNYNSGYGYQNYFCTETKYFLFDIEVPKDTIKQASNLDMSWFSLEEKSYKEAWKSCPKEILKYLKSLPEFQTGEAKQKFKEITGLDL
jgi:hypothetical protein